MLGGLEITPKTRSHAVEMLQRATVAAPPASSAAARRSRRN